MEGTYTLVGMLDSPFVRRVAITLRCYGLSFENLPLMTIGNAEQFAAYSPLKRAPTLILPTGEALFDSHIIVDHLDEMAPPGQSLLPVATDERLRCRQVTGIAAGIADKAVSAVYEKNFHAESQRSQRLLLRMQGQLVDSLQWLEQQAPANELLFGRHLSHADVLVGTALCFAREAHPDMVMLASYPQLHAWYQRLAQMDDFEQTYLPLETPS